MFCPICNVQNPIGADACQSCGTALTANASDGTSDALTSGTGLQDGMFVITKMLGQGGFGITYLSVDTRLRRSVAIKEFFPFGSRRDGNTIVPAKTLSAEAFQSARTHFLDEARVLARFQHPNIVHVHSFFEENGTVYMVMEFLHGKTLQELVETQGVLPEAVAVNAVQRVGSALETLHNAGLLHRDIKPDNVIVTDVGRVVLFDFGTTRTFTADKTKRMTSMVTPGYAPLEQYGQQARFGAFTDIYALGATMYHLLTGQPPVQATDRAAGVELQSPHQVRPEISEKVSDAVMWALEVKVDQRPQTVRDFLWALDTGAVPLALVSDAAAGSLSIASQQPGQKFAGDTLAWPQQCACCGGPSDSALPVIYLSQGKVTKDTRGWLVPYCSDCVQHVEAARTGFFSFLFNGSMVKYLILCFVAIFGGCFSIGISLWIALVLWAFVSSGIAFQQKRKAAEAKLKPSCCDAAPAVTCIGVKHGRRTAYTLHFKNSHYETVFKGLNAPKVQ
ncbi:MAG: serine/threonine protein kinase [Abitibacteriaceae bacterium]|nr:serine/threonine protein kinase [Abditibacteriaceae bacterium]